jgi:hypothetical protein
MPSSFTFAQVPGVASLALAAESASVGRVGNYTTAKNAHKIQLIFTITQGSATPVILAPNQAKTVAGGSAKAITFARWWASTDDLTTPSVGNDLAVRQTDGASFTTDTGTKTKHVICEIDPADLDMANGFITVAPATSGGSATSNFVSCYTAMIPSVFSADQPPTLQVN